MNLPAQPRQKPDFVHLDFDRAPFIVIWEITQACDLACIHCRAEAQPNRHRDELTTEEGFRLIDQIREFGKPLFVITGGDPLHRPDVFDLIRYGNEKGLRVALTPAGSERMTPEVIQQLKGSGLSRLAVSLDGSTQVIHDNFRKVDGSYRWTLQSIRNARRIGLPVQVNTTISRHNVEDVWGTAQLMKELDICLWSVFFIVPTGRGSMKDMISAKQHEEVFNQLYDISKVMPYDIKTTAAQHYRRVVMQRRAQEAGHENGQSASPMEAGGWSTGEPPTPDFLSEKAVSMEDASIGIGRAAKGVNDGNGFVFISHLGEVFPSGFLPVSGGNIREQSLVDIYRDSELFKSCRAYDQLKGKCGYCDFREVCGGSRSRSYAVTGDVLASEPYCVYKPPKPEHIKEEKARRMKLPVFQDRHPEKVSPM